MKRYIPTIVITTLISAGIFTFLYQNETSVTVSLAHVLDVFLGFILAMNLMALSISLTGKWLNSKISWKTAFGKRYFTGFIVFCVIAALISIAFLGLYVALPTNNLNFELFFQNYNDLFYKYIVLLGVLIIIYTLTDLAIYSYRQYAFEQINTVKAKREILYHNYNALKKQLSPHYLFNSLNTASSLLYRDTESAERYIRQLASSYQKILDSSNDNLVSLKKELDIIETYKFLMEIRFADALKIEINLSENLMDMLLPPLSLQLLVENAIKHNLVSDKSPLYIEIYCDDNKHVTIANNLNRKEFYIQTSEGLLENPELKSTGIGLNNIKCRYAYYTDKKVLIEKRDYFKVKLPLIELRKNQFMEN